jgi:hypothetical protein
VEINKQEFLKVVEGLSEDELRIVYTFIQEYRIAEMQERREGQFLTASENN